MRLIDSHAHIQADAFEADRTEVVAAARAAGVERLLVPGWDARSSAAAVALAEDLSVASERPAGEPPASERPAGEPPAREWRVDAAVGIHPHDAATATDPEWREVERLAREPRVVAIGETGLDYDRMHSPVESQLANLRRHLRLALETGKPVILHCRSAGSGCEAQDALIAELRAAGFGVATSVAAFGERPPGVLHSFSGPVDYARAALDMGLAIAFGGLVFRRGEEASAEVATLVPSERLLIETDSPYLAPPGVPRHSGPGFSGRRNSPEWVRVTAEWLAARRGVSPDSIGPGLVTAYDATFRGRTGR